MRYTTPTNRQTKQNTTKQQTNTPTVRNLSTLQFRRQLLLSFYNKVTLTQSFWQILTSSNSIKYIISCKNLSNQQATQICNNSTLLSINTLGIQKAIYNHSIPIRSYSTPRLHIFLPEFLQQMCPKLLLCRRLNLYGIPISFPQIRLHRVIHLCVPILNVKFLEVIIFYYFLLFLLWLSV
eukprot:TRINITY_DN4254_c0_g1_i3.p1 TRINITY_DN4254_c0_g1~~TRINITY_DN4254_c0_g1_i3.p1  ORF type:complete len:198 (+),score=-18.28 TRINITY_DN4254_c0_g1_i3:56-595(+)